MTYTVIVRDVNGNTLGKLDFEWDMTIALPPKAHVNDYGNVVVVTLTGDEDGWNDPDPLDRAEAEEYDARVGSLEDQGFPYAGGYSG